MLQFAQSNSQTIITITVVALFGLMQILKLRSMLNEAADEKIDQNISNVLQAHCPIQQKACNDKFDAINKNIEDLKTYVVEHSPNGELKTILDTVQRLENKLI